MVPGSTLIYGSSFIMRTVKPRLSRIAPIEAEAMPLPREDTTPPVIKMYRVMKETKLSFESNCYQVKVLPAIKLRQVYRGCNGNNKPLSRQLCLSVNQHQALGQLRCSAGILTATTGTKLNHDALLPSGDTGTN